MTKPAQAKHELDVTASGDREIVMKRIVDAGAQTVFDAFTKPDLIKRWLLGPDGWSMPVCEVDLRVGGTFHYVWRSDGDGKQFGLHGTYREIVPARRIVHVERFDEPWYPGDAVVTTTFLEANGTTAIVMSVVYASAEVRDGALESGMTGGVSASFDRLASLLG